MLKQTKSIASKVFSGAEAIAVLIGLVLAGSVAAAHLAGPILAIARSNPGGDVGLVLPTVANVTSGALLLTLGLIAPVIVWRRFVLVKARKDRTNG